MSNTEVSANPTSNKFTAYTVACIGLIAGFFLPWGQFLGFSASGYNISSIGFYGNLAWLVPISAAIVIWIEFTTHRDRTREQSEVVGGFLLWKPFFRVLAGLTPLIAVGVLMVKTGTASMHFWGIGIYISIISATVILFLCIKDAHA
jgi:hypothetical protein